jgi:hypothetical protein
LLDDFWKLTRINRWAFLEKGIDNVMLKLEEGVDMKTVCLLSFVFRHNAKLTLVSSYSTWLFIRSTLLSFPFGVY